MSQQPNDAPLISSLSDDPDMAELVEIFVGEMPARIKALQERLAQQDAAGLAVLAHQLKGSAGGYGFQPITDAAAQLEQHAKTMSEMDALINDVKNLADLCSRAKATS